MHLYHKQQELAPRDVVARAIDHQMKSKNLECVYLDISHKDENFIKEHFPNIYKKCLEFGFDLTKDLVPVVPAAHYTCGGVCVDKDAKTNIINLYAAGEVSYTGLHGANRMASNSLLECIVYAAAAAKSIKKSISDTQNLPYAPMYFIDFYKSIRATLFAIHPRFPRRSLAMTVLGIFLCKVNYLKKRGLVRADFYADLFVFSADEIGTEATYLNPDTPSKGIYHVMVNGQWELFDGNLTGVLSGSVLKN